MNEAARCWAGSIPCGNREAVGWAGVVAGVLAVPAAAAGWVLAGSAGVCVRVSVPSADRLRQAQTCLSRGIFQGCFFSQLQA